VLPFLLKETLPIFNWLFKGQRERKRTKDFIFQVKELG
jgi:hypothetical protein